MPAPAAARRPCTLPAARQLVAPLTVGQHVDHKLTQLAAEEAFGSGVLLYYEDYPYAQLPGKVAQVIEAEKVLIEGCKPLLEPLIKGFFFNFFRLDSDLFSKLGRLFLHQF